MRAYQKHTIRKGQENYHYLNFNSVSDFRAFCDLESQQFNTNNQNVWKQIVSYAQQVIRDKRDWFGSEIPETIDVLEDHKTFTAMHLLEEIRPKLKGKLTPYLNRLSQEKLPKPQLSYNDKGLGVFSFDKAAMGMFKMFSVNMETPVQQNISQMNIELGYKRARTSVKKVYAFHEKQQSHLPALQLYILAGANAQRKGRELLYVGLACNELVQFLEERNIPVEVNVMFGTKFMKHTLMQVIKVKRFQDVLNTNQLLLLASDPMFFRYQGFKSLICTANVFKLNIPNSLGQIHANMGKDFLSATGLKGMVFEQSYSIDAAVKEVSKIIENYTQAL